MLFYGCSVLLDVVHYCPVLLYCCSVLLNVSYSALFYCCSVFLDAVHYCYVLLDVVLHCFIVVMCC